ncbi:MAG: hypothetical protein WBW84_08500 [Acidobacteriaceae bacterium]
MSPRPRHIPDDAQRTTICLTAEENVAISWIREARRMRKDTRRTKNDILVDALWYFLEKTEGKTRDQFRALVPSPPPEEKSQSKVTEMPKPKPGAK